MMSQWSNRVFRCRASMWIRRRSHCRIADRCCVNRQDAVFAKMIVVHYRQLHKEIVRMLPIHNWPSERGFALLEKLRIPPLADCCRFQAEHRTQCKSSFRADLSLCHQHEPICRKELVFAARAGLLDVVEGGLTV